MRKGLTGIHWYLRKIKYFYFLGAWHLLLEKKAKDDDYWGRCREVLADPNNKYIPRVKDAGKIIGGNLIMHNGLKVKMGDFAYAGDFAYTVLTANKGVHEPQEERAFAEVLKHMPAAATMIELGSYWGFYSMWFNKQVNNAACYMIEPNEKFLLCGRENFKLNNMRGVFIKGKIGVGGMGIDDFIRQNRIDTVHMLHSDIQGAELEMLQSCRQSIAEGKIWYFFISTHSQKLHYDCLSFLRDSGYEIIVSADFDYGTYCCDGVLAARLKEIKGLGPFNVALHRNNRPIP